MIQKFIKTLFVISIFGLSFFSSINIHASAFSGIVTTNNFTYSSKNNLNLRFSSKTPITLNNNIGNQSKPEPKVNETVKEDTIEIVTASKVVENNVPKITISKIGLNNVELNYSSVTRLGELDQKLLNNPLIDTLTSEPCTKNSSTYIMGHSEPATKASKDKPAVRIFQNLDNLVADDVVELQNKSGEKCKYTIVGSEVVSTGLDGSISEDTFNRLYFPQTQGNSILKIQTCVKGSATRRLIYTAIMQQN